MRRLGFLLCGLPLFCLLQLFHWLGLFLDELLFRGYRAIKITRPVIITGVPRSGTTFLHRTLAQADGTFTTPATWEVLLAPSIIEKRLWRGLGRLDRCLGAPGRRCLQGLSKRLAGDFQRIHRIGPWEAEEDYLFLLPAGGCFLLSLAFPGSHWLWGLGKDPRTAPYEHKQELLAFYYACLQKHLYVAGTDCRLLSKNAAFGSWTGRLRELFPDASFILCVRRPDRAFLSQTRSIEPAIRWFGVDKARRLIETEVEQFFRNAYEHLDQITSEDHGETLHVVDRNGLIRNPEAVLDCLFQCAGIPDHALSRRVYRQAVEQTRAHAGLRAEECHEGRFNDPDAATRINAAYARITARTKHRKNKKALKACFRHDARLAGND